MERKDIPIEIQVCLVGEYLDKSSWPGFGLHYPLPVQTPPIPGSIAPTILEVSFVSGAPTVEFVSPRSLSEYLLVISLEELQEAGLGASGALHSSEAQVISDTLQVLEIHAKILNPKTATFPNCGQLSRPENNPKRTQKGLKPVTYFIKPSLLLLIITATSGKGKN